jgi:acetolactate synthase-1/2/3 large subunit
MHMPTIGAGQAIVEVLKAEGVKAIFGIPGGHTLPIYDALYDAPEVRHILVRHEQIAANMAAGYAQLTGEPGVCCATAGPGAANLVSGVAEAFTGALPIVILAGRGATATTHRGASQEIAQTELFRPITKWAVRVDRPDLIVDCLRQAFTIARSGKPGPVLVDIPRDILAQEVRFDGYTPVGPPPRTRGCPDAVRAAGEALAAARSPLMIAGGGVIASGAWVELRQLAEALGAPVITTLAGRGSLPEDHHLAAGGEACAQRRHDIGLRQQLLGEPCAVVADATTFAVQPDFAAIARACECYGEKIEDAPDIRPALERALLANGQGTPAVLDFIVARERVSGSVEFFAKS